MLDVVIVGAGPAGISSALKCAKNGYNTLIIEEGKGIKPYGGVVPIALLSDLKQKLGLKMPLSLLSYPKMLGLFYVPPSGKEKGGFVKGYKILNINRCLFNEWLRLITKDRYIPILFNAKFIKFQEEKEHIKVFIKKDDAILKIKTKYLIGADGVFSRVRKQIYPNLDTDVTAILQEYWDAKRDFNEFFYMFFRKAITPTYGYVIPKNKLFIIGTGVPKKDVGKLQDCIMKFKKWLKEEFCFKPLFLKKTEIGFIPRFTPVIGKRNVILAGDAGGFCNPFSGEGIRLAIESGASAGEALKKAELSGDFLAYAYNQCIEEIASFILRMLEFTLSMNDEIAEEFVSNELSRNWKIEVDF